MPSVDTIDRVRSFLRTQRLRESWGRQFFTSEQEIALAVKLSPWKVRKVLRCLRDTNELQHGVCNLSHHVRLVEWS